MLKINLETESAYIANSNTRIPIITNIPKQPPLSFHNPYPARIFFKLMIFDLLIVGFGFSFDLKSPLLNLLTFDYTTVYKVSVHKQNVNVIHIIGYGNI